jgi:hypothetical protein
MTCISIISFAKLKYYVHSIVFSALKKNAKTQNEARVFKQ